MVENNSCSLSHLLCISVVIVSVVIANPSAAAVSVIAVHGFFFDLDAASEVVCSAFFPAALSSLLPPPLAASGPRRPPGRLFAVAASVAVTPGSAVTFAGARAAAFAIFRTRPKQKPMQNNYRSVLSKLELPFALFFLHN